MGIVDAFRRRVTGDHHDRTATDNELAKNPPRPLSKGEIERALNDA